MIIRASDETPLWRKAASKVEDGIEDTDDASDASEVKVLYGRYSIVQCVACHTLDAGTSTIPDNFRFINIYSSPGRFG